MFKIDTFDRILSYIEAIDVENEEYVFWDATGRGVSIAIEKAKISAITLCAASFALSEAFTRYLESMELSRELQSGNPVETWDRIQAELSRRPKRRGWLSRLFSS